MSFFVPIQMANVNLMMITPLPLCTDMGLISILATERGTKDHDS